MSVFRGEADKLCGPLTRRDLYLEQDFWRGALRGYTKSRVGCGHKWEGLQCGGSFSELQQHRYFASAVTSSRHKEIRCP